MEKNAPTVWAKFHGPRRSSGEGDERVGPGGCGLRARPARGRHTPSRVLSTSRNSVVSSRSTAVRHDHRPCARRRDCRRGKMSPSPVEASGVDAIVARPSDACARPRGYPQVSPSSRPSFVPPPTSPLASWSARDVAACVRVLGREFAREEASPDRGTSRRLTDTRTPSWRTASTARSCRA